MKETELPLLFTYFAFLLALLGARASLAPWVLSLISIALLLSLWQHLRLKRFFPNWILNGMVIVAILALLFFGQRGMLELLIYFLIFLNLAKFFGQVRSRDIWQIYALSFALICVSALWNFQMSFGILLILFTWVSLTGLSFLNASQIDIQLKTKKIIFIFASLISLGTVLIAIFFFLFLPRSPYTFFLSFGLTRSAKTGFTSDITLNHIEEIREDKGIAFRAVVDKKANFPLYWRGIVYDTYKDGHWQTQFKENIVSKLPLTCSQEPYKQIIFLEPYEGNVLFALPFPVSLKILSPKGWGLSANPGLSFSTFVAIFSRVSYVVYSCPKMPEISFPKDIYLQVPSGLRAKLKTFLKERGIKPGIYPPQVIAEKIKTIFLRPPFRYTKKIPPPSKDPIYTFLFVTHQGWCEYFASAMTLLLRTAGVPARLIGGYQGGTWNEMGHYYIVRQKDAHTWVEYWDGHTWRPTDPTPSHLLGQTKSVSVLTKWLDYFRLRWYIYILNYDFSRQRQFFKALKQHFVSLQKGPRLGLLKLNKEKYKKIAFIGFCLVVIALLPILVLRHIKTNPALKLRQLLKSHGYSFHNSDGLLEMAAKIAPKDAKLAQLIADFAYTWYETRFGNERGNKKELRNKLERIKKHLNDKVSTVLTDA